MALIPDLLLDAIKSKKAVLFLGAGASKEAKNSNGHSPPDASQLRDILAMEFFKKPMPNRDVMAVAEMASEAAGGRPRVFEAVRKAFDGFHPSDAHKRVPLFYWRTIATTNYDLLLESAYSACVGRVQTLIPFVKDDEPILDKLQAAANPVPYLKLHGSLDRIHDKEIPLVLSREQYADYLAHRTNLYGRLSETARQSTFVFVGYRLDDLHIRDLFYKVAPNIRPRWYIVTPDAEDYDVTFWATKNVEVIRARFGEFMAALDAAVPAATRKLTFSDAVTEQPIRKFFVTLTEESALLRKSLDKDFTFVHAGMPIEPQDPKRFYEGYDTGWGGIVDRLDVRRKVEDDLLYKALLENEQPDKPVVIVLLGAAGAGKTIALKRTAFEAATASNALVLWLNDSGALHPNVFVELHDLTKRPIYLFIDQIGLFAHAVSDLLHAPQMHKIPLVVVAAERDADWYSYCATLNDDFDPALLRVGNLSQAEVEGLLDLLERHHSLGDLSGWKREEQVSAFMEKERADRQLLVALHELTRGKPFEEIVLDEYQRILPDSAQQMYLDIATMHQFGVKVRAGTISRISSIRFEDYRNKFFEPLKNIVRVADNDPYTGDYYYQTRHARVAALVFRQVCSTDEAKAEQFKRLIEGFDIGYSVDRRALEEITRGRALAEAFITPREARIVYQAAIDAAPDQAFLYQQWAIFESLHNSGSLAIADEQAAKARELDPRNRTIIHTQAEIDRKRANIESSSMLRASLRRRARDRLNEIPGNSRFVTSSRCKLLVDEVDDMGSELADDAKAYEVLAYAEKIKDAENTLLRAQQMFPDDADIIQVEARLRELLKQKDRALSALERARAAGPRGSGIAIRIAKAYAERGRPTDAIRVLKEELAKYPDDKPMHHAMAMHLLAAEKYDFTEVENHFARSYSAEDQNFEDRFLMAQLLFAHGEVEKARKLFDTINARAPEAFRHKASREDSLISARLPRYSGTIGTIKNTFSFIRSGCYPQDIFAHNNDIDPALLTDLNVGSDVNFRVRFNRSGPVAVDVKRGHIY